MFMKTQTGWTALDASEKGWVHPSVPKTVTSSMQNRLEEQMLSRYLISDFSIGKAICKAAF